jgi:hypothetical protein
MASSSFFSDNLEFDLINDLMKYFLTRQQKHTHRTNSLITTIYIIINAIIILMRTQTFPTSTVS